MSIKNKKPKHAKEYYMKRKKFFSSCSDAFGVMSLIVLVMLLTGTFDWLFPFSVKGLYGIFTIDTLCIILKWSYYNKAVKAAEQEKKELSNSGEE